MTSGELEIAAEATPAVIAAPVDESVDASAEKTGQKQKKKVRVLPRQKIVKVLSVGLEVTGTVKRVSEFGAFVDINAGRDGLLHISELSTTRVHKVTDVVQEGQEVTVWIKELDRERNRISLTMIAPGTKSIRDLEMGELVKGTVTRLTNYGAFVDIGLERDAMLHVKEMGDGYVAKPEDVVRIGEEIEARISGVDARRGRIDLSLKGLRPAAAEEASQAEVYLEPAAVEAEEEVEMPTSMEMAFRMALSEEDLAYEIEKASRRSGRRRRNNYREEQNDIISRTLRYNS